MTKKKARSDLRYDWEEALRADLEEALIEFKQLLLAGQILTRSAAQGSELLSIKLLKIRRLENAELCREREKIDG